MQNTYNTKDFYLAAALVAAGMELQSHYRSQGLTTFIFTNSHELQQSVREFHDGAMLVNPITYGHSLRNLKGLIHTSKPNNNYETLNQLKH